MANNEHADLGFIPDDQGPSPELDPGKDDHSDLGFKPDNAPNKVSTAEALIGQLGMGMSAGTLPKISAGVQTVAENPMSPSSWPDEYKKALADTRQYVQQMQQQHPVASTVGQLAGGLLTPVGELGEAAQGAGVLAKMGQAAKSGATYGALEGFGNSDKDLKGQLADTAEGAAVGGAIAAPIAGVMGLGGKIASGAGDYLSENPLAQKLKKAYQFGADNPDFYKLDKRKAVLNNLRDTVEEEALPLVDDTLEGKASDMYDEAKKQVQEKVPVQQFMSTVVPTLDDDAQAAFNASDSSRYVLKDLTRTLSDYDKDGVVDINKAFDLRNKVQSLMSKVSPKRNPIDGDAYTYLNQMKSNLDGIIEQNYGVPLKDLNSQYSKIGDFKAEMGTDIRREDVQDYKNARSNALDSLSSLFTKASADPASPEAMQVNRAYGTLDNSDLISPETINDSRNTIDKAANDANIIQTMYGGGMHVKGTGYLKSLGLGPKAIITQAAAGAGAMSKGVSEPVKSVVYNTAQKLNSITPDALSAAAEQIGGDTGNILKQLAAKPEGTRNAMLFTMMQQPAYQQSLKKVFGTGDDDGQ